MALAESFVPREWQAQIIGNPAKGIPADSTKYKVIVAHRKSGKTVSALMLLFMLAWKNNLGKQGIRVPRYTYIGPTIKQARDIAWDLLKDIVPSWALYKKPNETNMEIRLKNGVILNVKGADKEESLRGPGLAYALLDEYSYMKPNIWESVIRPELASTGGGATFIGTPNGRDSFYDLFTRGRDGVKDWKSWLLPCSLPTVGFDGDVERGQLLLEDNLADLKATTTEKWFNQEYECAFIDNAGAVFDRIDENVVDEFRDFPEAGHRYRIGLDVALREDWTVIAVLDLTDRRIKYVYRTNKTDLELQLSRIENESAKWTTDQGRPEIVMDTTGMGDPMYEQLTTRGNVITPIKFTNQNKHEMVKTLALMFNKDEIKIPRYEWLIDELKDYRYDRTITGKYRYGAPDGKHDDGVSALLLATYKLPPLQPISFRNSYQSAPKRFNPFTGTEL